MCFAVLLASGLAVVSAEESSEEPESFVTLLEPGDNLVGWVGETAPIEDLLEAVPQIELMYTWDAERQRYRYAVPGIDVSGKALHELTSETSVVIRIGEEPLAVDRLFAAVPEIQLIYRWDSIARHWDFALRALGPDHRTLEVLAPGTTATIRVGAEPVSAQALLEAAPQIDHIFRYDQSNDSYAYAFPGLTPATGGLNVLTPGMGLVVRLSGEKSIEWERPRRPAQGTVSLRAGRNLVAWMGRDEAPLGIVRRGIGRSLTQVGLWSSEQQDLTFYDSDGINQSENSPSVEYGTALWIQVALPMQWLQPTGITPEIVFAGPVSKSRMARVHSDVRSVLDFYSTQFGVEADFSDFLIYIPTSARELILAQDSQSQLSEEDLTESRESRLSSLSNIWASAAGWASRGPWHAPAYMVVKQELWGSSNPVRGGIHFGRSVTAHEYMHVIQHQLNGAALSINSPPNWFLEGAAEWVEDAMIYASEGLSWDRLQADARRWSQGHPELITVEQSTDLPYGVGRAAAHLLTENAADDSLIELYRVVAGKNTGPHQQWKSWPTWPEAFQEVFGLSIDDFHEQFEEWRGGRLGSGAHGHSHDPPFLSGRVIARGSLQSELNRVRIIVRGVLDDGRRTYSYDWVQVGSQFDFPVYRNGTYTLAVEFGDPACVAYYSKSGAVQEPADAQLFEVRDSTLSSLILMVSSDTCTSRLEGKLVAVGGQPLAGIPIAVRTNPSAQGEESFLQAPEVRSLTKDDGRWSLFVPKSVVGFDNTEIDVLLRDDCGVRVLSDASVVQRTISWTNARGVQYFPLEWAKHWSPSDRAWQASDSGLRIEIDDEICAYPVGIVGLLTSAGGVPVPDAQVFAEPVDGKSYSADSSDLKGSFNVVVPEAGEYRLSARIDGCSVYYVQGTAVGTKLEAALLHVLHDDVRAVVFRIPNELCVHRITGRLVNADGTARSGQWVRASGDAGSAAASTASDGSFSFAVPSNGSYWLSVRVDSCQIYYGKSGPTNDQNSASQIAIANADVTGIYFRLREGLCGTEIAGRLLDAHGDAVPGTSVRAARDGEGGWSVLTDSEGGFSITLPEAGVYRLIVSNDDCRVYFRRGGSVVVQDQATRITISDRDVTGVRFQLREGQCSTKIGGRVLDAAGNPIAGSIMALYVEDDAVWRWVTGGASEEDGTFSITVPETGQYRLIVGIDGCTVYYRRGGVTGSSRDATLIPVADSDITGINLQLAEGMCELRVSGKLLNADGTPNSNLWVSVSSSGGGVPRSDGSFSFAVIASGSYRLSVWVDGCSIYRGSSGPVDNWNSAAQVRVSNADVRDIEFRLPEDPSSFCN